MKNKLFRFISKSYNFFEKSQLDDNYLISNCKALGCTREIKDLTYRSFCETERCTEKNKCCNSIHWKYNLLFGGGAPQWTFLQHNGPLFPPEYEPHKIPIIVNSIKIVLPPEAEEYATIFTKYLSTDYINNNIFKKNFWKDFKILLSKDLQIQIPSLDNVDFSLISAYLEKEKEKKLLLSKEEKEEIKRKQDEIEKPYKYCIIDGIQQNIGNYKIEPPSIFLGRGTHPKLGSIKKRIYPEDIVINLSKDATIPEPSIKNHTWGKIIHDRNVIWLASWKENISGKNKYIFTSFDSFFKSKSDESKFDLARKLKKKVHAIRTEYEKQLEDSNLKIKQSATALYLIDNLALRIGGNKDTKEEADTVGVTSLRVEHISLLENNIIKLDFLGKDSIRYCKKIAVHSQVYENLLNFIQNKMKKDQLFDLITPTSLNEYLTNFMVGLTSKVWRTYNASMHFQKELDKIKEDKFIDMDQNEKLNYLIAMFNQANTAVALLCNHQKNTKTTLSNFLAKIDAQIKNLKKKKKLYKDIKNSNKLKQVTNKINALKLKKETKIKMCNVSLNTSKNNYIDPRIIFAFIKKFDIPPEKIFTKTLLKRFEWSSTVDKNYRF
jgi:DNA topoisomerase-1